MFVMFVLLGLWLSDKEAVQMDIIQRLCQLVYCFSNKKLASMYLRLCFRTVLREWSQLDQYRINKFYSLLRIAVRECFIYMSKSKWSKKITSDILSIIEEEMLKKVPNGVRFHVADIYLEEIWVATEGNIFKHRILWCVGMNTFLLLYFSFLLFRIYRFDTSAVLSFLFTSILITLASSTTSSGNIQASNFMVCLQPFLTVLRESPDSTFLDRILNSVFRKYLSSLRSDEGTY